MFIRTFLYLAKIFPQKEHPFHSSKNGILDLNYSDFEYKHTKNLLLQYKEYVTDKDWEDKKILDVGCGAGGKWVYIAEKYNSEVVGIDLSKEFLWQAEAFAKEKLQHDNTRFLFQSALETEFSDNSFDIILMSDVLEHIPNTEILLEEVMRILKPWGKILFDFAPYYHYFGHHLWDTLPIPWLHVFTSEKFRISLYKRSVCALPDGNKRIELRISKENNKEKISYLNKITLKNFINIISKYDNKDNNKSLQIKYFMLKNANFMLNIPLIREIWIRHIVWCIKK